MTSLTWTEEDRKAVDIARILAADAVQSTGNGHPGTPVSLAPVAHLLYQKVMNTDPGDDKWIGRDRFVLSAGHASVLQYAQFYINGLGLELDDLKRLRKPNSLTPGHPEYGHTKYIECTTGPLGAGVSMAVGMAMAARYEHGLYDPDAAPGESVFDHFVYVIAGDGCMQEGVQSEAASLAGAQELGNLIVIYDANRITIEGDPAITFNEDVLARYAAYGWDTAEVDWTHGGERYEEDVQALHDAIEAAKRVTDRPSIIKLDTIIGWPLPTKAGNHAIHGSRIGAEEIAALKEKLGFPAEPFAVDEEAVAHARANAASRGKVERAEWDERFEAWKANNPKRAVLLERVRSRKLPADLKLPVFEEGMMSTRKASGEVLSALAPQLPELWGGSADLAGSNNTTMKDEPSFLPDARQTEDWPGNPYGRTIHFGIREHAMGGIINGIVLSGLTRAYGGTFMVFADYMRPAVRLAALMNLPSIFVWSHDSIGVGEDGPTHQPVEHLASLRAIPHLDVVRPADANETSVAWGEILRRTDRPAGIILSRQDLRIVARGDEYSSAEGVARGGYVLKEASEKPRLILIASGSEVALALEAAAKLEEDNVPTRVVSMPCMEWFDEQGPEYCESVLPKDVKARVSIEAGIAMGWGRYVGDAGASISIECFGASAAGSKCFKEYGFTVDNVIKTARSVL